MGDGGGSKESRTSTLSVSITKNLLLGKEFLGVLGVLRPQQSSGKMSTRLIGLRDSPSHRTGGSASVEHTYSLSPVLGRTEGSETGLVEVGDTTTGGKAGVERLFVVGRPDRAPEEGRTRGSGDTSPCPGPLLVGGGVVVTGRRGSDGEELRRKQEGDIGD